MKRNYLAAAGFALCVCFLLASCATSPYPYSHRSRLSGTGIDLSDYELATTSTMGEHDLFVYELLVENAMSPNALLASMDSIWDEMPSLRGLVNEYGLPPRVWLSESTDAVWLNVFCGPVHFFIGTQGTEIREIRFSEDEGDGGFRYKGIGLGSAASEVTAALGNPVQTIEGEIAFQDQVLYVNGNRGYIAYNDQGIRFFMREDSADNLVVSAMYLFGPE